MRARYFGVSLVYYRTLGDPQFIGDSQGMPIGIRGAEVQIGCTTGFAMAPTAGEAITMVRAKQEEGKFRGWIEQVAQAHELPLDGWWPWTLAHAKYWGRYLLRFVPRPS